VAIVGLGCTWGVRAMSDEQRKRLAGSGLSHLKQAKNLEKFYNKPWNNFWRSSKQRERRRKRRADQWVDENV